MDNSFDQQESDTQKSRSLFSNPQILYDVLNWLAGLFQLTEEERDEAGIYFDNRHEK
jgi:hypothetical protein